MGKTNKGQRTKGNTRPSSSGHTAQLLNSSGKALSGFIGFEALEKEIPSYVPVAGQHTVDTVNSSVDSDFRMVMRKMLKRDVVTRLKAVQEFGNHCAEKDKDIVKNVLPFWPRLFNKLALDTDRRIREATHEANGKLIFKVKREVAPYLKNIMGVWLLGQCDLYAPAATSAQATFTATFPSGKQSEALMFCKTEIFAYFKDNLFEQTAKTMSETNLTSAEDVENKYILVISATLQALKLFLTTILHSELQNIYEDLRSVVVESKFWKYAKNKESLGKYMLYMLLKSLLKGFF
ncbi:E3 ubiquitin-protein ligase listerin-like [Stegodyphus dumicola]|uniref:E3 ubiquitin-protein ligase listerin-like n=1 Tax=Stegodyphus dumicola TaxID=202533 RepID=UPI0015B2EACC|nr:E3 ubiquitin-protein ligase listerin-like [Stegodyphus dumicola]